MERVIYTYPSGLRARITELFDEADITWEKSSTTADGWHVFSLGPFGGVGYLEMHEYCLSCAPYVVLVTRVMNHRAAEVAEFTRKRVVEILLKNGSEERRIQRKIVKQR